MNNNECWLAEFQKSCVRQLTMQRCHCWQATLLLVNKQTLFGDKELASDLGIPILCRQKEFVYSLQIFTNSDVACQQWQRCTVSWRTHDFWNSANQHSLHWPTNFVSFSVARVFSTDSIQFLVADFKSAISFFLYVLVLMQSAFYYSYLGGILYISFVQFRPIAGHWAALCIFLHIFLNRCQH